MTKTTRTKHKAARARSRLNEVLFGTVDVRIAAVHSVNDIGLIVNLLRSCVVRGCGVIGLQEAKREGISEIVAYGILIKYPRHGRVKNREENVEGTQWDIDRRRKAMVIVRRLHTKGVVSSCII